MSERNESIKSLARRAGVPEAKAAELAQRLKIKPARRDGTTDVFTPEDAAKLAEALKAAK